MMRKTAVMIAPDAYPQMLGKAEASRLSGALRSAATEVAANRIIADSAASLRGAVLAYIGELKLADGDIAVISGKAHDIKGFADMAGLPATARLVEGLCRYLEDSDAMKAPPDAAVIALYVRAVRSSASDSGRETQACSSVARALAALAARKLADAGNPP